MITTSGRSHFQLTWQGCAVLAGWRVVWGSESCHSWLMTNMENDHSSPYCVEDLVLTVYVCSTRWAYTCRWQPHWVAIVTVLVASWLPAYPVTYQVSFNLDTYCHSNNKEIAIATGILTLALQSYMLQYSLNYLNFNYHRRSKQSWKCRGHAVPEWSAAAKILPHIAQRRIFSSAHL